MVEVMTCEQLVVMRERSRRAGEHQVIGLKMPFPGTHKMFEPIEVQNPTYHIGTRVSHITRHHKMCSRWLFQTYSFRNDVEDRAAT